MDQRPKWQVFLMTYSIAFVAIMTIGLAFGDSLGEAARAGISRALLFGTPIALVVIGMSKANRSYDELEQK